MPQWHSNLNKKKTTGGRKRNYRAKRSFESGSYPIETKLGEAVKKIEKRRGNTLKLKILKEKHANITNTSTNKTEKAEILRVIKNPTSVDYDRRKIMTKGSIIETSLGEAKITSRPGQNGVINAVLTRKTRTR
ncbi:MAG: 30S ribosomal protein S8e [Candidatus Bathyarchaeota archaeon]|nr:MAG: 30S ribosomal protein S8e [Candidatus Bathyarchaeota archaeon]